MTGKDKSWKVLLPELYNPIKAATMENGKSAVKNAHTLIPVKLIISSNDNRKSNFNYKFITKCKQYLKKKVMGSQTLVTHKSSLNCEQYYC